MVINNRLNVVETSQGIQITDMITGNSIPCLKQQYFDIISGIKRLFRVGIYMRDRYTEQQKQYIEGLFITPVLIAHAAEVISSKTVPSMVSETKVVETAINETLRVRI